MTGYADGPEGESWPDWCLFVAGGHRSSLQGCGVPGTGSARICLESVGCRGHAEDDHVRIARTDDGGRAH
jgi:hypothetical protein